MRAPPTYSVAAATAMMAPLRHSSIISLPGIATFFRSFVRQKRRKETNTYTAVQTCGGSSFRCIQQFRKGPSNVQPMFSTVQAPFSVQTREGRCRRRHGGQLGNAVVRFSQSGLGDGLLPQSS